MSLMVFKVKQKDQNLQRFSERDGIDNRERTQHEIITAVES